MHTCLSVVPYTVQYKLVHVHVCVCVFLRIGTGWMFTYPSPVGELATPQLARMELPLSWWEPLLIELRS